MKISLFFIHSDGLDIVCVRPFSHWLSVVRYGFGLKNIQLNVRSVKRLKHFLQYKNKII